MEGDALSGHVVLVIEDEPSAAQELHDHLKCAGAIIARHDLQGAREHIQQRRLSAAVLDCHPTSRERRALIRSLRQNCVPIIFYGANPPGDVTTERGALFIEKPCSQEKIVAAVRYLLGRL